MSSWDSHEAQRSWSRLDGQAQAPERQPLCALCVNEGMHQDEVSGTRFCAGHAGPLMWSDHDVDAYSLALKLAGMHDAPLPLPKIMVA